jgi:hypothetical protein
VGRQAHLGLVSVSLVRVGQPGGTGWWTSGRFVFEAAVGLVGSWVDAAVWQLVPLEQFEQRHFHALGGQHRVAYEARGRVVPSVRSLRVERFTFFCS